MEEIEKIRNQLGMTRKEFEEYYRIPKQTLYQWEKGLRKPPSYLIKLLNEKIERETKGEQLRIATNKIEYHCFSINKKGMTRVFPGLYLDSVEKWKENMIRKNERAWIEVHEIIETIEVN